MMEGESTSSDAQHRRPGPLLGLGKWTATDQVASEAVKTALQLGYRHIDTAWQYRNGGAIGKGIKESGVPRSEIFLLSTRHTRAEEALEETLEELGTDYLDLWLMHWPVPLNPEGNDWKLPKLPDGSPDYYTGTSSSPFTFVDTWLLMESAFRKYPSKVRAIGVSNCSTWHLSQILEAGSVVPAVNQIEIHPQLPQDKVIEFCRQKNIAVVAYSPLGSPQSTVLTNPKLETLAGSKGNGIGVANLLINWALARGYGVIPKTTSPRRMTDNLKLVDLTEGEMQAIRDVGLSAPKRYCTPAWAAKGVFLDES
ncbi:NADP-dependent oxidoreductase domain-containing protein [Exophiala viscosa]|uniref:NADP-dependent oxidoreductase domain-containing protein n=1 Tax=Exophiala viscosa TaxID=2486360 RepID=A0AAN6IB65_9EURO|nr:NADP-dependent oxidoreductase domain-containing protein [Exophiala viscosa]